MTADVKSINIKNRINYFFNDMISIEDLDSSLLKIEKIVQKYRYLLHWIHHN